MKRRAQENMDVNNREKQVCKNLKRDDAAIIIQSRTYSYTKVIYNRWL